MPKPPLISATNTNTNAPDFTRRRLPHWHPAGRSFFVTFRLFGSLPDVAIERLIGERERLHQEQPRPGEAPRDRALRYGKRLFALADGELAEELKQPNSVQWLAEPAVAEMVCECIRYRDGRQYRLIRHSVLPNHVHLLIGPLAVGPTGEPLNSLNLSKILHSLKSYSAQQANKLLRRDGTFWQDENFDHWVRDDEELGRIVEYIDQNPVQAGLCSEPWEWVWSSAGEGGAGGAGGRGREDVVVVG